MKPARKGRRGAGPGTMTRYMLTEVDAGWTLALTVRPRCKARVRMMEADPVIGCFCLPLVEDGEQWTNSYEVASWIYRHPFSGIAVRILDEDEVDRAFMARMYP